MRRMTEAWQSSPSNRFPWLYTFQYPWESSNDKYLAITRYTQRLSKLFQPCSRPVIWEKVQLTFGRRIAQPVVYFQPVTRDEQWRDKSPGNPVAKTSLGLLQASWLQWWDPLFEAQEILKTMDQMFFSLILRVGARIANPQSESFKQGCSNP